MALFFNGALGSVDIDGLRDRDWEGLDRTGRALARSVSEAADTITPSGSPAIRGACTTYTLPGRRITDAEWRWAQDVLAETGGQVAAVADGVGDDYKAAFYRELHDAGPRDLPLEQTCLALGDSALLTFPGELYTEIGQHIKAHSPFQRTSSSGWPTAMWGMSPPAKLSEKAATRRTPATWTRPPNNLWSSTAWRCFTIFMEHPAASAVVGPVVQPVLQLISGRSNNIMRTTIIPDIDFQDRVKRLQLELAAADLDVLITYSSESEAASSRYLADFWPFFDFAGVIVPREGAPALVTGGPESYEFARQFSRIKDIHIIRSWSRAPRPTGCRPSPTRTSPRS